jgi:small subunit ribosomal protein S6
MKSTIAWIEIFCTFAVRFLSRKVYNILIIKLKRKTMLNRYETVFILTPVLSDEQMKEAVNKFLSMIEKAEGAKIVYEEKWGLRKLAYPIQKKSTGFYHLIEFEADGTFIQDFEIAFKRDERILRFLTVKLDKHMIAYAEKKRANKEKVEVSN